MDTHKLWGASCIWCPFFMLSVSRSETTPERGRKAAPAPLLPAGGIISTSFTSWMKKVTTTSLLLYTRKLLQVSGLKGFIPSLDGYIKNNRSWGTAGGKSKEQMLGGAQQIRPRSRFHRGGNSPCSGSWMGRFWKGHKRAFVPALRLCHSGSTKQWSIQEKNNPHLFTTRVWRIVWNFFIFLLKNSTSAYLYESAKPMGNSV